MSSTALNGASTPRRALRRKASAFRSRYALHEYHVLRGLARRTGYHLVPATYYSPIPDLDELPESIWAQPDGMAGIDWDLDAQMALIEDELAPYMTEFDAPLHQIPGRPGFYFKNGLFASLDADVLYAMVRRHQPQRVIEIGAGYSTLVAEMAAERNREEGFPLMHEVFDPFPSDALGKIRDQIELYPVPATEIDLTRFDDLGPGDILFVDTTHTVKPGGEVVHLLLGALPRLPPGVIVHIHDFYRPYEYPSALMRVFGSYWQEHYLVQAFLAFNREFRILCANHALGRLRRERIRELVPRLDQYDEPSSLWLAWEAPAWSGQ